MTPWIAIISYKTRCTRRLANMSNILSTLFFQTHYVDKVMHGYPCKKSADIFKGIAIKKSPNHITMKLIRFNSKYSHRQYTWEFLIYSVYPALKHDKLDSTRVNILRTSLGCTHEIKTNVPS